MTPDQVTDAMLKAIFHGLVIPLVVVVGLFFVAAVLVLLIKRAILNALGLKHSSRARSAQPSFEVPANATWRCTECGDVVSSRVRGYCLSRPHRFGGQVYCFIHQRWRRRRHPQ